jgi:signal peptidase
MVRLLSHLPSGLAAAVAILTVAIAAVPLITPVRTQIVVSGSMAPNIPVGALVVTAPIGGIAALGDVILFPHPLGRTSVVHRVVAVEHGAIDSNYVTKGDANDREDGWRISVSSASGQVIATIPLLGYAFGLARLPLVRLGLGVLILALVLLQLLLPSRLRQRGRARDPRPLTTFGSRRPRPHAHGHS